MYLRLRVKSKEPVDVISFGVFIQRMLLLLFPKYPLWAVFRIGLILCQSDFSLSLPTVGCVV